ncbi:hypothetical protein O9K51_01039 [Purpureocillium lavendulum]|uniref:Uncharacterized protein n=1 Tax=Purpureocillium lavendulum TaxID=1247861 RepID=A0AB34G5E2_9HYPO|nr:hypothetical protein O9K51_01039 [Purpureocillium lavendulum]
MHQAARLDLVGCVVWKLLSDGNVAVEVLNEHLQESVQLEEGKARLERRLAEPDDGTKLVTDHGDRACICLFGREFEVEKRRILLGMLKIELIEAANTRKQHTVGKLLHVATCLQHYGWICRDMVVLVRACRLRMDGSLRQV